MHRPKNSSFAQKNLFVHSSLLTLHWPRFESMAASSQEDLLCEALEATSPEALVAAVIDGRDSASPFAACLGSDKLACALDICRSARLATALSAVKRAAATVAGLEREIPGALQRLAAGEAVDVQGLEGSVRRAFEACLLGAGLSPRPQPSLDGDVGYAAESEGDKRLLTTLAKRTRPPAGPALPPPIEEDAALEGPQIHEAQRAPLAAKRQRPDSSWTTPREGGSGDCGGLREAWMMTPPEALRGNAFGVAKTRFKAGKQAEETRQDAVDDTAARAALEAARADRGPPLVDLKRQQQQRSQKPKKGFSWSRDDMTRPRALDAGEAADALQHAAALGSRFSSSVQSSFI